MGRRVRQKFKPTRAPQSTAHKRMTAALRNWVTLNAAIKSFSEKELQQMLAREQNGQRRKMIMRRLHQRLSRLRMLRERKEL